MATRERREEPRGLALLVVGAGIEVSYRVGTGSIIRYQIMADGGQTFSIEDARRIGDTLGIDWASSPFDVEQFLAGLKVELEHGRRDPQTDVTPDDPIMTGKIALAHLKEFPDYYTRLARMEREAENERRG